MTNYFRSRKHFSILLNARLLIGFVLLLFGNSAKAQQIHISGEIENGLQNQVSVMLYPYFSVYWQNNNAIKYESQNSVFLFEAKLESAHSYVSISLKNKESQQNIIELFLVTPGDSVHIVVRNNHILFTGRGSEKYTCQNKIQAVPELDFSQKELLAFDNNTTSFAFNMYRKKKIDSILKVELSILKQYENKIPSNEYKQLALNFICEKRFRQYLSLEFQYTPSEDLTARNDKIKFFHEIQKEKLPPFVNDMLVATSNYAIEFLLCKAKRIWQFERYISRKSPLEKYSPFELATVAGNQYGYMVREHLLAISFNLFYRPLKTSDTVELVQAIKEVKSDYFLTYMYSLKRAMNPGGKSYDFSLSNTSDQITRLSDFKDKVIVLDFWFTGCSYCIRLEKRMKEIRKFFKENSNVVFVSICLDTEKDTFLKSVASGNYTDENGINLFTGTKAFDHPIAKYYNITGCPEMVIIDKNHNIFISKPDRPVDARTDRNFINLILKAIAE